MAERYPYDETARGALFADGSGYAWTCPDCGGQLLGQTVNLKTIKSVIYTHRKSRRHMANAAPTLEGAPPDRKAPAGRSTRSEASPRPAAPAKLKQAASSLLHALNIAPALLAPGDALNDQEIDALAEALAENSFTGKYVRKLGAVGTHAQLASIVVAIALPRLARHGWLPTGIPGLGEPEAGPQPLPFEPPARPVFPTTPFNFDAPPVVTLPNEPAPVEV